MKRLAVYVLGITVILFSNDAIAHPHGPMPIPLEEQEKPNETTATMRIGFIPLIPAKARRSGFCCMIYDVTAEGMPKNISTSYCTAPKFRKPSIEGVKQMRFNPAISNNVSIEATNQSSVLTYLLTNRSGEFVIPDRKKLMIYNGEVAIKSIRERVCINGER